MRVRRIEIAALGLALVGGCMLAADAPESSKDMAPLMESEEIFEGKAGSAAAPASPKRKGRRAKAAKKEMAFAGALGGMADNKMDSLAEAPAADDEGDAERGEGAPSAPTRSWFPETFLFEPRVITGADGTAEVKVKVPDRLTTWRVLALAHNREGSQAGAVSSFRSTLDVYVDPVMPAFLHAGDEVEIPVQIVNTTDVAVRAPVKVEVEGGRKIRGGGTVTVPGRRSVVQTARLAVDRPGTLLFAARLEGKDAIEKSVPVYALGRPVQFERSGTLAAPRKVSFELPDEVEPGSARVRLQVFPGALGLLRSELARASGRRGLEADAYSLLLAGRGPALLEKLGAEADPKAFRRMGLVAAQRAIHHGRSAAPEAAALLAEAALAHPDNPVMARLGARLAQQVARAQRPDGTFSGGSGWALRRVLVATAEGVAAVQAAAQDDAGRRRAAAAALRASGAFERYAGRIDDPYTAAMAVASGAAQGSLRDRFRARVREAIGTSDTGKVLPAPKAALRADGLRPGTIECTAAAVLALAGDPEATALIPDLGATLLSTYRPGLGWGDGRTNLLALRAVLEVFREPLPKAFRVILSLDDETLMQWDGSSGARAEMWANTVARESLSGKVQLSLRAEPPVPGLGYSVSVEANVPWDDAANTEGLELQIDVGANARVGRPLDVTLRAAAPANRPLEVRHALPAGVQPDERSLAKLVSEGKISGYETEDGAVTFTAPARDPGQSFVITYRVVPTLAGRLRAGASRVGLTSGSAKTWVPPSVWTVR